MPERALLALLLLGLALVAVAVGRRLLAVRDRRLLRRLNAEGGAARSAPPRIVYFTAAHCTVCRARQEPALEAVRLAVPALVVEQHDAVAERALAKRFGVLTVPTTVVYAADGKLVSINRGFTPPELLERQVAGALAG